MAGAGVNINQKPNGDVVIRGAISADKRDSGFVFGEDRAFDGRMDESVLRIHL